MRRRYNADAVQQSAMLPRRATRDTLTLRYAPPAAAAVIAYADARRHAALILMPPPMPLIAATPRCCFAIIAFARRQDYFRRHAIRCRYASRFRHSFIFIAAAATLRHAIQLLLLPRRLMLFRDARPSAPGCFRHAACRLPRRR